jgi:hypothetical protein
MPIFFQKLDGRHSAHRDFSHRAEIFGPWDERRTQFVEIRDWCWENFGPGIERELRDQKPEAKWAWHISESPSGYYIYLKDEMLTYFSLKWK